MSERIVMERLTPWYPPEVLPVRSGVYRVAPPFGNPYPAWYHYFDAARRAWLGGWALDVNAAAKRYLRSDAWDTRQDWAWCGLYGPEGGAHG